MYRHLATRREGSVERVTLDRPELRNAFNPDLIQDLTAWAAATSSDAEVRVAVLSGAGPAFCAGADINWMAGSVK
jgi:methylglutaconyl-CoA hydratase